MQTCRRAKYTRKLHTQEEITANSRAQYDGQKY